MLQRLNDRLRKDEGGFTLIELLVVIIIIGILLAIAVPSYLGFRDRAANSAAQANVRAIVPAVEAYYSDHGSYSSMSLAGLKASYDQSINTANYAMNGQTSTSYCISSTVSGKTFRKVGPSGAVASGATCT
jgi:type IV pilus assembly protein PilA